MSRLHYAISASRLSTRLRNDGLMHFAHRYGGAWCYVPWAGDGGIAVPDPVPVTCFWCLTGLAGR